MPQSKKKTPKPKPQKPPEQEPSGFIVQLVPNEQGDRAITVTSAGDVRLTEAPTILRLAAKNVEVQLGIE